MIGILKKDTQFSTVGNGMNVPIERKTFPVGTKYKYSKHDAGSRIYHTATIYDDMNIWVSKHTEIITYKCRDCFYFRGRFPSGRDIHVRTHCNNIAQKKEMGYEAGYWHIDGGQDICKRFREDGEERKRRSKQKPKHKPRKVQPC